MTPLLLADGRDMSAAARKVVYFGSTMAGPPPAVAMVSPNQRGRQGGSFRWVALGGAALMICVLVAALGSTSTGNADRRTSLDASEYRGMPDPDQAVDSADKTVASVLPFHNLDERAAAGEFSTSRTAPRMLTRPRYATLLGKEAALHASSQPFLVALQRRGQKVPGAIAPFGEYAPVTPAYSNPLAQFIPNVTYYPTGNTEPSTGGDINVKLYNPFDDDNTTIGFMPKKLGTSALAQAEQSAKVSKYLAHLYNALAEEQTALERHNQQESKIQAAIQRVQEIAAAQMGLKLSKATAEAPAAENVAPSAPIQQQLEPLISTQQVIAPSVRYNPSFQPSVGLRTGIYDNPNMNIQYVQMNRQEQSQQGYARPVIRVVSPRGPAAVAETEMPEFA